MRHIPTLSKSGEEKRSIPQTVPLLPQEAFNVQQMNWNSLNAVNAIKRHSVFTHYFYHSVGQILTIITEIIEYGPLLTPIIMVITF